MRVSWVQHPTFSAQTANVWLAVTGMDQMAVELASSTKIVSIPACINEAYWKKIVLIMGLAAYLPTPFAPLILVASISENDDLWKFDAAV